MTSGGGLWTLPQRGVLIVLLTLTAGYLAIRLFNNPEYVSSPQPLEPSRGGELEDRIDPNRAEWHTLAVLPVIGEKRARDIIAYRERFVVEHPGQPAFVKPEDMLNIRGIGSATLAQIQPYLIFPELSGSPASRPD